MKSFSIVICHFGDVFWTKFSLSMLLNSETKGISRIYIINQDRSSKDLSFFSSLDERIVILEYDHAPLNRVPYSLRGSFDHANSLNLFIKTTNFESDYLLILDNDCFPTNRNWINEFTRLLIDFDLLLAEAPKRFYLTHPCLMVIPTEILKDLDFKEGMQELGFDTGRLIGLQSIKLLKKPYIALSALECGGIFAISYLNRSFIHLVSTSYQEILPKTNKIDRFKRELVSDSKKLFLLYWKKKKFQKIGRYKFIFLRYSFMVKVLTLRFIQKEIY